MILTSIFIAMMIAVFGPLLWTAIKMAWGITKVVAVLVFLPIVLIVLAATGLFYVAIPVLAIIGLVALIKMIAGKN